MDLTNLAFLLISLCINVRCEFPNDPKPCKYGDTECIKEVINYLFREKSEGEPSLNLRRLRPLKIENVHLHQDQRSPVKIDLLLKNSHIHGFENAKVLYVKGFGKDMTKTNRIVLKSNALSTVGNYTIDGKILLLPIKGEGGSNITMVDVTLIMDFVGVPYEKDGATYTKIEELKLDAEPKRIIYKVDNLFNGDKALGDNMNLFLNENWEEIFNEAYETLAIAFGNVFKNVMNEVLSAYPYEKLFAE